MVSAGLTVTRRTVVFGDSPIACRERQPDTRQLRITTQVNLAVFANDAELLEEET